MNIYRWLLITLPPSITFFFLFLIVPSHSLAQSPQPSDQPEAVNEGVFFPIFSADGANAIPSNSVAWGDADGDGDLDVAVGTHTRSLASYIYFNQGNDEFEVYPIPNTSGFVTKELVWGDLDGDGDLDLAMGNDKGSGNFILINDGTGRKFERLPLPQSSGTPTFDLSWGDYTGDGFLDLIVANCKSPNQIYRNNHGMLQLQEWSDADDAMATYAVAWGDFDNDGDLDLAVGNHAQPNQLFENDEGSLELVTPNPFASNVSSLTTDIAWAYVDGDDALDLIESSTNIALSGEDHCQRRKAIKVQEGSSPVNVTRSPSIAVWRNITAQNVPNFDYQPVSDSQGFHANDLAVGDINGDNHPDIVTANGEFSSLTIIPQEENQLYLNDGDGNYNVYPLYTSSTWTEDTTESDTTITAEDEITATTTSDTTIIAEDKFTATMTSTETIDWDSYTSSFQTRNSTAVDLGDMDGDGDLDLAESHLVWQDFVLKNTFEANFQSMQILDYMECEGKSKFLRNPAKASLYTNLEIGHKDMGECSRFITTGDINGDGFIDLIAGDKVFINHFGEMIQSQELLFDVELLSADCLVKIGHLLQWDSEPDERKARDKSTSKVLVDVNNDGFIDLISGYGIIYLNDGVGKLIATHHFDWCSYWEGSSLAVGHLNNDQWIDIVAHRANEDRDGCLPNPTIYGVPYRQFIVPITKICLPAHPPSILYNVWQERDRTRQDQTVFERRDLPDAFRTLETTDIELGDLNGDGNLDILVGVGNGSSYIFFNDGDGSGDFSNAYEIGSVEQVRSRSSATSVEIADFDSDGDLDFILGNINDRLYENDGLGGFSIVEAALFPNTTGLTYEIESGDIDLDGDIDLIFAETRTSGENYTRTPFQPNNLIYLNNGAGRFSLADTTILAKREDSYAADLADLDNDGDLDIIFSSFRVPSYWYENRRVNQFGYRNRPPAVQVDQSSINAITNNYTAFDIYSGATIPIAYELFDVDRDDVTYVQAEYSLNGGGNWLPAIPDGQTLTTTLTTFDNSLYLDGGDGGVRITDAVAPSTSTPFSAEMWVHPLTRVDCSVNAVAEYEPLLERESVISLRRNMCGQISWRLGDLPQWYTVSDISVNSGEWSHVTLVYNQGEAGFYLNGELIETVSLSNISFADASAEMKIGYGSEEPNSFYGFIRDVHIWNGEYTPEPYRRIIGDEDGLQGAWSLNKLFCGQNNEICSDSDSTTQRILYDQSQHGQHGRWVGSSQPTVAPIGASHTFYWDTHTSGFFGESDNVVFRISAYPQVPSGTQLLSGTIRYFNHTIDSVAWAYTSASSFPFRARGTQLHVVDETATTAAEAALIFRLQPGEAQAQLMTDAFTNRPLMTNDEGFVVGRGSLNSADRIFAAVPMTRTFRMPPQLIFEGEGVFSADLSTPISSTNWTAEMWLFPNSDTGSLWEFQGSIENKSHQLALAYSSVTTPTRQTTLTLTLGDNNEKTTSVVLPTSLNDGFPHHLAVTLNENDELVLFVDGEKADAKSLESLSLDTFTIEQITVGRNYRGAVDDIRLWSKARLQTDIKSQYQKELVDEQLLSSALVGYWPITEDDKLSINDLSSGASVATVNGNAYVWFRPLYTILHTSGAIAENGGPLADYVNGVQFQTVGDAGGTQVITVTKNNPLILFDLDVSLEWDARADTLFLLELEDSFRRASALLYEVTHGQAALGRINLFHNKAYWGVADIVIHADNSLRPSAAIGGVTPSVTGDTLANGTVITDAYFPGQVHMGTVWDPYGERTADLGEEWVRTLTHELGHYLFYLPDNYLGIENGVFRIITCPDSFMTATQDPSFTQFLNRDLWRTKEGCLKTLAHKTTERSDWETIKEFYNAVQVPADPISGGPTDLPLNVTTVVAWVFEDEFERVALRSRNYDIRNVETSQRLRLPNAQAYLFKTANTAVITDDVLIPLGNPTGGGDRLKVRGANAGDRLCVFENDGFNAYTGCVHSLDATDAQVKMHKLSDQQVTWLRDISAQAITSHTVEVTVELSPTLAPSQTLMVQLFPMHYPSVMGNAPVTELGRAPTRQTSFSRILTTTLPTYDIAVRVWITGGNVAGCEDEKSCPLEAITLIRLNPAWENDDVPDDGLGSLVQKPLQYAPIGGPNNAGIGGPNNAGIGGPNNAGIGGPNNAGIGGPNNAGIGGPTRFGTGTAARTLSAPALSGDAQIAIYNTNGFFEDTEVDTIQALPTVPAIAQHPWLYPVGQAYRVKFVANEAISETQIVSLSYLQRDVPEGYEYALALYFLASCDVNDETCDSRWQRLETQKFVENFATAQVVLDAEGNAIDGTYALMVTVQGKQLQAGQNLFFYSLPVSQTLATTNLMPYGVALKVVDVNVTLKGDNVEVSLGDARPATHLIPGYYYLVELDEALVQLWEDDVLYFAPPRRCPNGHTWVICDSR